MISISTITPQTVSTVVFNETVQSRLRDLTARVSRTATLDGSCVITHSGVTDADRTLDIRAQLTADQADDLQAIYESVSIHAPAGGATRYLNQSAAIFMWIMTMNRFLMRITCNKGNTWFCRISGRHSAENYLYRINSRNNYI